MFGLNPWGHHLTNVLLHALKAGLVFGLLQLMTGTTWRSLLVAALFAVHPLRVESAAWVSERKGVLSGFFGLLALMAYACYAEGRRQKADWRTRKSVARGLWSVIRGLSCISHLLSSFPLLPRPRLDEQANAGDVAVRDVATGLLAPEKKCGVRNAECGAWGGGHRPRPHLALEEAGLGKGPVLCSRGVGERRDLRGAEARRLYGPG
jgi:hypothetical protein